MKSLNVLKRFAGVFVSCLALCSCDDVFEYHPYDTNFDGDKYINSTNIPIIEDVTAGLDTFTFAFISDTHLWHSEAEDIVADINSRDGISFVVHGGDLTDTGTTTEFEWTRDILDGLTVPYVALLGNHDCLGTGTDVYAAMYGDPDFSFIAGRVKFICINTNALEYDYPDDIPDLDFIADEGKTDTTDFDRTIVIMHARPYSDQFNDDMAEDFEDCVTALPGIMFCANGHDHRLQVDELFGDGIVYYGTTCAEDRQYLLFTITPTEYVYEVTSL